MKEICRNSKSSIIIMNAATEQNGIEHDSHEDDENRNNSVTLNSCQRRQVTFSLPVEWRRNGILTDVTLVAKSFGTSSKLPREVKIPAHKIILAMGSEYFKKIFEQNTSVSELYVPSVDPDHLNAFVRQIYQEETVSPTEGNVERLYIDAEFLGLSAVRRIALDFMYKNINAQTWAKRLIFCRQETLKELGTRINAYVSSDYTACLQSPEFENLNVFEVIAFLRLPARCSCPEHELMLHLLNWIRKSPIERATYTAIVLKELNLAALPDQLLHHYFSTEPLLNRCDANRLYKAALLKKNGQIVRSLEVVTRRPSRPNARPSLAPNQTLPENEVKNSLDGTMMLLPIKMSDSPTPSICSTVSTLPTNGIKRSLRALSLEPTDRNSPSPNPAKIPRTYSSDSSNSPTVQLNEVECVLSDGHRRKLLFYVRQSADEVFLMATDVDSSGNPWEIGRFCGTKLQTFLWVESLQRLYALGGQKRGRCCPDFSFTFCNLNSEENLPLDLTWFKGCPMKSSRMNFMPVVLDGYIYVFGGSKSLESQVALNSAERINIMGEEYSNWEEIDSMLSPREQYAAVVLNGKIYVCGGLGGPNVAKPDALKSVECYNPASKLWEVAPSMNIRRFGHSCVTFQGKIYAIGGSGWLRNNEDDLRIVEVFDPKTNNWTMSVPLARPRRDGCAVVLDDKIYAIGGDRYTAAENDQVLSSIEMYDPTVGKWEFVTESFDDTGIFNAFFMHKQDE